MDSIQAEEKLTVLLRQGAPDPLYLQVEARVADAIMCLVGFSKERKRRGKSLSGLPYTLSEKKKEL